MPDTLHMIKAELLQHQPLLKQKLHLQCGNCIMQIQSNSLDLLATLQHYFRHILLKPLPEKVDMYIVAIESETLETNYPFKDWLREPAKSGRKEAYYDIDAARLIRKVRTGMLFLQSASSKIAAGPCLANSNQVINFINNQYMNWLQQRQWLICHAAAVSYAGRAYALAGFSGGGKSTLMLHLLNNDKVNYISNDRLFIRQQNNRVDVAGIAKLPRINPGTIVHNPRLQALLSLKRREQLLRLPKQQLWELEEKYDVDIEAVYGAGRMADNLPLQAFIVLNWQHDSAQACQVTQVDIQQRRDLLGAIMKSPGPFFQDQKGQFLSTSINFDQPAYLSILATLPIYEVSGKVDFAELQRYFYQQIINEDAT